MKAKYALQFYKSIEDTTKPPILTQEVCEAVSNFIETFADVKISQSGKKLYVINDLIFMKFKIMIK